MNDSSSSQRNWFPVIVAGLTLALAAGFYAKFHPDAIGSWTTKQSPEVVIPSTVMTSEAYIRAVTSIFSAYEVNADPAEAYDALILLHVPAEMQQFHIDCIFALGKLKTAKNDAAMSEAMARFTALQAQYSWFTFTL